MKTTKKQFTFKINSSQVLKSAWTNYKKDNSILLGQYISEAFEIARNNKAIDFDQFYRTNYKSCFNYVKYLTNNYELSQEITSEAFIKILNSLSIFNAKKSNLKTYLLNAAKNLITDYKRKNRLDNITVKVSSFLNNETGTELIQVSDNICVDQIVESNEANENLLNKINSLDDKYKNVLQLYYVNQYSYKDIAELLNLNINTIKCHLKRGKELLTSKIVNTNKTLNNVTCKKVIGVNNISEVKENELFYELENDNFYY